MKTLIYLCAALCGFAIHAQTAPAAPSELTATIQYQSSFGYFAYVLWRDNSTDETSFYAERAQLVKVKGQWVWSDWINDSWGWFGPNPGDYAAWTDGTVDVRKHTYKYRIRAENAYGVSAWSNEALLE